MQLTDFEMEGGSGGPEIKKRQRSRKQIKESDDLLLPLLARTSSNAARQLIKKHGEQDAANPKDLEFKLANVYKNAERNGDALLIEKELAEIHPHKDWLIRTLQLVPKSQIPTPEQLNVEQKKEEKKSSCEGGCQGCRFGDSKKQNNNDYLNNIMLQSSFDAITKSNTNKNNNMELIALVAITGIFLYVMHKH